MKRFAHLIGWLLLLVGGAGMLAALAHALWLYLNYPPWGILSLSIPALMFSGIIVAIIGIALVAYSES